MATYSIRDLEKLSGIKAHTIRIWEQRYDIIQPKRTKTNIRYYDDADLKYVLNIALLNKSGIRISKIAKMSKEEIAQRVGSLSESNAEDNTQQSALTIAMVEMNELKFEKLVANHIVQFGFEQTMLRLILPFLEKLSLLWLTGTITPVHEQFISNLIRQKILVAINRLPLQSNATTPKFILYLPEAEYQELNALFIYYLLRARGFQVLYLGANITLEDLTTAYALYRPEYVFTLLSEQYTHTPTDRYIQKLHAHFPKAKLLLTGYQVTAQKIKLPPQSQILECIEDIIEYLEKHTPSD